MRGTSPIPKPDPFTWKRVAVFGVLFALLALTASGRTPLSVRGPIGFLLAFWVLLLMFWGGPPLWRTFLPRSVRRSRGGVTDESA